MSKINQMQAAALSEPVEKITPTKPATKANVVTKAVVKSPTAQVPAVKPATKVVSKKVAKPTVMAKEKIPKPKMERDSFTMPKSEYAQLYVLKDRLAKLGSPAKKSELLRAGIMQLNAMTDTALKLALSKVPTIKTGRPKKK